MGIIVSYPLLLEFWIISQGQTFELGCASLAQWHNDAKRKNCDGLEKKHRFWDALEQLQPSSDFKHFAHAALQAEELPYFDNEVRLTDFVNDNRCLTNFLHCFVTWRMATSASSISTLLCNRPQAPQCEWLSALVHNPPWAPEFDWLPRDRKLALFVSVLLRLGLTAISHRQSLSDDWPPVVSEFPQLVQHLWLRWLPAYSQGRLSAHASMIYM